MWNSTLRKVTVASAILVILIGVVLHFTRSKSESEGMPVLATSQESDLVTGEGFSRRPARRIAEVDHSEPADVDAAGLPRIPREKVEEYLTRNQRSAASLLAAFHALDDTNYLHEAAAKFPNGPHLQWTVLARDAFPEERRKWLDLFKTSSPDNSLANYLSAADHFKNGQTEAGIQELLEASRKKKFKDYAMDAMLEEQELGRAAGRTPLEAVQVAGWGEDLFPELGTLKKLAHDIGDAQKQHLGAGDSASANNLVQMELTLADRLTTEEGGRMMLNLQVGISIEALSLRQLDQNARYDFLGGKTPSERLAFLKQAGASLRELQHDFTAAYPKMTEAEVLSFNDLWKTYGEAEALRWVQQRFGTNVPGSGP